MASQIWVSWTGERRGGGGGCPSRSQWSLVKPCREKVIRLKNGFQKPSLMHRMRQPGALSSVVFSFSNSQLPLTHRLPLIARIFITYNIRSRLNISVFNTEPVCQGDALHTNQYFIQQGLENNLEALLSREALTSNVDAV